MPVEALNKLRQKYPEYRDIPDRELARRIIARYPEYRDLLQDVAGEQETQEKRIQAPTPQAPARSIPRQIADQFRLTAPGPAEQIGTMIGRRLPNAVERAIDIPLNVANVPFVAAGQTAQGVYDVINAGLRRVTPGLANTGDPTKDPYRQAVGTVGEVGSAVALPIAQARRAGALVNQLTPPRTAGTAVLERPASPPIKTPPTLTPEAQTATARVIEAIRAAKPVRAEQEAMYSAERSRRLGKVLAIGAREPTVQGTIKQLGALKGELPKPEFTPLAIEQADMNALFRQIESSPLLSGFSKPNARFALLKLFGAHGGQVPTDSELALLGRVFGKDFVGEMMSKRPFITKASNAAALVTGSMKAMSASVDLSAPFRQGVFAAPRYPKQFISNFAPMVKSFLSEDAYQGVAHEIATRPSFPLMEQAKLALTAVDELALTAREEAYVGSQWVEKIPILGTHLVRGSNRAYSSFLTKFRADIFDSMIREARKGNIPLTEPQLERIGAFINTATGRGELSDSLAKSANALSTSLFSPRLIASRVNLLNPYYYIRQDPFVRKEALKTAGAFYGTLATVLGLAKLRGADVGADIRSADFAKIKEGNTRYEISGGFQPYVRLAGQLATGEAISTTTGKPIAIRGKPTTRYDMVRRFIESKFSPVASLGKDILEGENFEGPINLKREIIKRFVPLILQDAWELYQEEGVEGLPKVIPGVFGVGVQTYGPRKPGVQPRRK